MPVRGNLGVVDVEFEGVQRDGLGVLGDVEVNDDGAVKGQLLEVGLEGDMVVAGDDIGGEKLPRRGIDPTCHFGGGMCSAHVVTAV